MSLCGRVAIVTGATKGIGLAIARRLGRDGATVVVSSRQQLNVDSAVDMLKSESINAHGIICRVADGGDRTRLVDYTREKLGRLDILVNNAGINPFFGDILDTEEQAWDETFDTNLTAGFLLTKLAVPHMDSSGKGNVVFVSSMTGYSPIMVTKPAVSSSSTGWVGAYTVTKTAMLGLTKALAMSLANKKIRVNAIAPGIIRTELSKPLWGDPQQEATVSSQTPLGRLGTPDDCSGIVFFLCSDDASFITGETVLVTGGLVSRL